MRSLFCSLLFAALLLVVFPLWGAYFTFVPTTLTQPDGTRLECFASGDEYHNWLHDKDGYTIIQSQSTGYYSYAQRSGEDIVPSDLIAGRDNPAMRGLVPNINISLEAYRELRNTRFQMPDTRDAPTTGTINNLVVFIRFSGEAEFGQTIATYDGWFNTSTSSQKNYFLEASYNQLTVNTTFYPAASGGYVVSWQDSHARGYFQPYNASTNPIGYQTDDESRNREFTLLAAAIAGVGTAVPADLVIDSDNDGQVDNVVFVISGNSDGWSDLLWPHRWAIYDRTVTLRGKRVYDFNLQLRDFLNTYNVGVICHEFFHTLGAPDLYHYNENVFSPVGSWDLMENNTNPPQHMGAYMKWKYGDWIPSIPVITNNGDYTLNPLTSSTNNCYRINSPSSSTEYFVVEYRRKTGTYENSLPGSGMLIYRINTTVGDGNADGPPDEVYLYRPGGTTSANGTVSSANYSSSVGRTAINATTNPTPFLTSGAAGGLNLSGISAVETTISFTNNGGLEVGDPNITWNPTSFSQELLPEATASQTLQIGNSGDRALNYTCSLPTSSSVVLNESFENAGSIPTGWTEQFVSGNTSWDFDTGGYSNSNPSSAYDGNYNARLFYNSSSTAKITKLISPAMNLSSANSASLSFWHTQAYWAGDQDKLKVYYKTSAEGAWNLLAEYTVNITNWTQRTIALPNLSGSYYIAFEGITDYGYGVCLDKVVVTAQMGATTPWITLNGGDSASGSISVGGIDRTINVGFNAAGLTSGTYNSTITITSNSTTNSTVSIPVTLTISVPSLPIPFAEGFESGLNNWQVLKTGQTNYWMIGSAPAHTGTSAAYITNNGSSNAYTTTASSVSHLFRDLSFPSGTDSFKLRFVWKGQGQGAGPYNDYLRVFLINPGDALSAGTELSTGQLGSTYNLNSNWTEVTLDLPEALNGLTKRLVFSWRNDSSSGTQPPAAVDIIRV
ncbi:MAG: M6 family metalloprotease domain-containing protein, partial [Candidatus Cloacimonadota bacterium]